MRTNPIGTIFRTFSVDEPHLLKLRQAGLECIQLAGAVERYLDDPQLSDHLFTLLDQHHLAVPSLFLSFERQTWATGDVGLTPKPSRVERMLLAARQMLWAARRNIPLGKALQRQVDDILAVKWIASVVDYPEDPAVLLEQRNRLNQAIAALLSKVP